MSTRSVVAKQTGDDWLGRYVHSDGYPTAMVRDLLALVARDGRDKVVETVVDAHAGWSLLRPQQPDFSRVRISRTADYHTYQYGTPESYKVLFRESYSRDKRFVNVPGYGIAYTSKQDGLQAETSRTNPDAGWSYVLTDKAVLVFYRMYGNDFTSWTWLEVGRFPFGDQPSDEALRNAECGASFERCEHCAYVHFPEAEGTRVGVGVWLGRQQPGMHDIVAVLINGKRVELSGGGSRGTATDARYNPISPNQYWWAGVRNREDVKLGRFLKTGFQLNYSAVVPTAAGDVILPKGELIAN